MLILMSETRRAGLDFAQRHKLPSTSYMILTPESDPDCLRGIVAEWSDVIRVFQRPGEHWREIEDGLRVVCYRSEAQS